MHEKSLIKSENSKNGSKRSASANKHNLVKSKEVSSCGSCGVCKSFHSPQMSTQNVSLALSHAKAMGKESCAVSFIQKNYGNSFTSSILKPAIQKKCSCGGSCPECKGEEEAERISMSIMKMGKPSAINYQPSSNNDEQSQISEIMSNKGSGQSLDDNTNAFMRERFGYDFSHVRIHTDSYAVKKSNELNAEAFTIGRDVFFNAGRYNPTSTDGKRLLVHELTHVVQQGGIVYKSLQRRCGEDIPAENHATVRAEIVNQAQSQIGEHYLWGTEGERPGLGDVVMANFYQGAAMVSGGCVCAGKHSDPGVAALPQMTQSVLNVEDYCQTHSFLRQEGADPCGGNCGSAAGCEIWGECCIGHRHFDCSGFVHWSYNQAGYNINRTNVSGYQRCDRDIVQANLQPGDLCYIDTNHVGIYAGNNQVVEAKSHAWGVVLSPLAGRGWNSYGSLF